ncbi:MAG: protease modulator HflC [Verrucomicrobiae bacterium]|nr:protease modulator HflC [Verrucomicrobiae bacterium]
MKTNIPLRLAMAAAVGVILFFYMFTFQVRQNEKAVKTRFGRPVRVITEPGLYWRWPWPVEATHRFDARLQFYECRMSESLTRDKRNVIALVFVAWKVGDPLLFLQSMGNLENAKNKLEGLVSSAKNAVLGVHEFRQLVSEKPDEVKIPEIERQITEMVRAEAAKSFGVQVVQTGITRLALPESNTRFVFDRMRAERAQLAAKYRAEGRQQADEIRAKTDAEKIVLLAEAKRYAEETRGKAEGEAARIYAAAHRQDPGLYRFLRELEALRVAANTNTTLILDADSPPFRALKRDPLQNSAK